MKVFIVVVVVVLVDFFINEILLHVYLTMCSVFVRFCALTYFPRKVVRAGRVYYS